MQTIDVPTAYLRQLEQAVLAAEWWLADVDVARRKDAGQRKQVFVAADQIRQRQREQAT